MSWCQSHGYEELEIAEISTNKGAETQVSEGTPDLERAVTDPGTSTMLSEEQRRVVQETWAQVVPIADTAAGLFYDRLFELDPSLRKLFETTDMPEQRRKLMQTLGVAVNGLKQPEQLVSTLKELGRRHGGYGVKDRDYDTVGEALLWTLEQGLGEAFTPFAREAWAQT